MWYLDHLSFAVQGAGQFSSKVELPHGMQFNGCSFLRGNQCKKMSLQRTHRPCSDSGKDLYNQASMRRFHSNHRLCYSVNRLRAAATQPKLKNGQSYGIFPFQISSSIIPNSLRSLLFDLKAGRDLDIEDKVIDMEESLEESVDINEGEEIERANWVERLLEIRTRWSRQPQENIDEDEGCDVDEEGNCKCDGDENGCSVDYSSEEGERGEMKYDQETFSRMLSQVPWSDTKLFSKPAFLCNMAYVIPHIKPNALRRYYGLHFVTSSLEKKAEAAAAIKAKLDQDFTLVPLVNTDSNLGKLDSVEQKHPIQQWVAYEIAASAASYVHARAKGLPACGSKSHDGDVMDSSGLVGPDEEGESSPRVYKSEMAAYVAASTMTLVVAAGEKEKQEVAKDLQSLHSLPCDWGRRRFVHRGIYEAAKGTNKQFMQEIIKHLNKYGERAKLQFIGHSLGGSLSLLVNLMLLTRNVAKLSTLRPVVTFGSPFVFCGGKQILDDLGLDDSHVHCVMMHRDIVPRAFSCKYPNHVAMVLKRLPIASFISLIIIFVLKIS